MKKQYIFIWLIWVLIYLIFLIGSYKLQEYKIYKYSQKVESINDEYNDRIEEAQDFIKKIQTPAYKNKSLKFNNNLKNPGEEVITLISQWEFEKYTQKELSNSFNSSLSYDPLSNESLISTMTPFQKWVYLIFNKDIR